MSGVVKEGIAESQVGLSEISCPSLLHPSPESHTILITSPPYLRLS